MKRHVMIASAVLILAACCSAQASALMEKMRAGIKAEALQRYAKFQSYSNSQQLHKDLDARCVPMERAIERAFSTTFCATGCSNTAAGYASALSEVHQATQTRLGTDYVKDLRACLTEAIALDRDRNSYAMAVMLRLADKREELEWSVIWASSSLALGKGVPKSTDDAIRTLQEIARPDSSENFKQLLMQLAVSLYDSKPR